MGRRQTISRRWLIIAARANRAIIESARGLPRGSGVLLLQSLPGGEMRQLRLVARNRDLTIVREVKRTAARVHNARELRDALIQRAPLILLSAIHPTSSHPAWEPIARMRAAALARLGRRNLIALGGMNERRYARIAPLGFIGWAGISAWSERPRSRNSRK